MSRFRSHAPRRWTLIGPDGKPYGSERPGELGGHKRSRIYGKLDCRAALRAIARGGYVANRVFFLNEGDAKAAGYRPCGVCMPDDIRLRFASVSGIPQKASHLLA